MAPRIILPPPPPEEETETATSSGGGGDEPVRISKKVRLTIDEIAKSLDEDRASLQFKPIPTRLEDMYHAFHKNPIEEGHAIFYAIRQKLSQLDNEKYYRSKDQRLIQHRICGGLARFVYGPELRSHEIEVKNYNKFESLRQEIFLTAPRRGGKTQSIAQLCAVLLLCVPHIEISAFAPSARAAGSDSGIMGHVKKIMMKNFGVTKFAKHNEESLFYAPTDADVRKFHAYPGGATHKYVLFSRIPSSFSCIYTGKGEKGKKERSSLFKRFYTNEKNECIYLTF
jgi:hypothetical protein